MGKPPGHEQASSGSQPTDSGATFADAPAVTRRFSTALARIPLRAGLFYGGVSRAGPGRCIHPAPKVLTCMSVELGEVRLIAVIRAQHGRCPKERRGDSGLVPRSANPLSDAMSVTENEAGITSSAGWGEAYLAENP